MFKWESPHLLCWVAGNRQETKKTKKQKTPPQHRHRSTLVSPSLYLPKENNFKVSERWMASLTCMHHFNWHLFCKEIPKILESNRLENSIFSFHFSAISKSKYVKYNMFRGPQYKCHQCSSGYWCSQLKSRHVPVQKSCNVNWQDKR